MRYLMDCFLYYGERQTLYNLVEHYIPNFSKISKTKQFEILLMGICPENPDFTTTNTKISIAADMEKGADARTLSTKILENCGNFWIVEQHLLLLLNIWFLLTFVFG